MKRREGVAVNRGSHSSELSSWCGGSIAVILLLALAAPVAAQVDRYLIDTGPLRVRDQFLAGLGFLGFDPVSADLLERGQWQLDVILTASNTFAHSDEVETLLEARPERQRLEIGDLEGILPNRRQSGIFYLDGEHARWALAARRGLGHGFQVELVLPVIHFGGGQLDATVEGFHDTFSLGQAGRLGVPRDGFLVFTQTDSRQTVVDRAPGTALGDAVVGARYRLLEAGTNRSTELALEALVKLPTGDVRRLASSGSADFGAQLLGARYFRRSCLHFSVGAAYLGRHELFELESQTVFSGMLAWEIGLGLKTTALIQATIAESPFGELDSEEIGAQSTQLTFGVKRVVGGQVLFLGLTENLANFNNTADIGLHVGVTRTFGPKEDR